MARVQKSSKGGVFVIAVIQGSYMLFDGLHKLITGGYLGSRLGPWAHVVSAAGVSPDSLGPVFVTLGLLWLAAGIAFLSNRRWPRWLLVALGLLTLAYLVFGTILSVILLALLTFGPRRRGSRTAEHISA